MSGSMANGVPRARAANGRDLSDRDSPALEAGYRAVFGLRGTYRQESLVYEIWPIQSLRRSPPGAFLARLLAEAVAAIDRPVAAGLEGEVRLLSAGRALGHEDLARPVAEAAGGSSAEPRTRREAFSRRSKAAGGTGPSSAVVVPHPGDLTADHAALGFVAKAELRMVFLLLRGENEVFVAVLALQRLVGERHPGSTRVTSQPVPAIP